MLEKSRLIIKEYLTEFKEQGVQHAEDSISKDSIANIELSRFKKIYTFLREHPAIRDDLEGEFDFLRSFEYFMLDSENEEK